MTAAPANIVDLTHAVTDALPTYPGDPVVRLRPFLTVAEGGYHVTELHLGTHSGTHVDAPRHIADGATPVDRLDLDRCVGPALVVDVETGPDAVITLADCDVDLESLSPGARVLLRSGWSQRFGDESFFTRFPSLDPGFATALVDAGVALVGLEQPSVHQTEHLAVHATLLDAGVVLVESLAHLDRLTGPEVFLACLPMAVAGGDGAPVRAVAWELVA